MALNINSVTVPFRNVEIIDESQLINFKQLKKANRLIRNTDYIISKADLRAIIEDPDNEEFDAFRIFPLLKSDNSVHFYLMPIISGGGVGPGPGQGVKVPGN